MQLSTLLVEYVWHMSSHTFGTTTTGQHFGKFSAGQCLIFDQRKSL